MIEFNLKALEEVKIENSKAKKINRKQSFFFSTVAPGGRGKTIEMEDVNFHQCVKLSRFETDHTISFVPPDGEFDLMTYRLSTTVCFHFNTFGF